MKDAPNNRRSLTGLLGVNKSFIDFYDETYAALYGQHKSKGDFRGDHSAARDKKCQKSRSGRARRNDATLCAAMLSYYP